MQKEAWMAKITQLYIRLPDEGFIQLFSTDFQLPGEH